MLILVKMLTTAIVQLLLAKPPCLCVVILITSVCNLDLKYDNKKKVALKKKETSRYVSSLVLTVLTAILNLLPSFFSS